MTILRAGDTAKESDFINASERDTGTPANDFDKLPRLEDVGGKAKVSPKLLGDSVVDVTLGETIDGTTTPKACFVADAGTEEDKFIEQNELFDNAENYDNTDEYGQPFNSGEYNRITEVKWDLAESGIGADDNIYIEIYAVDGNYDPTGSALVSKVFNSDALPNANGVCVFDSPVTVSKNTDYIVVGRVVSSGGDNYKPYYENDSGLSSMFPSAMRHDVGAGWVEPSSVRYAGNFYIKGYELLTSGKVYKSGTENTQRKNFNGFVAESGVLDDVVGMRNDKSDGFTGLTVGADYFIGEDGDISVTESGALVGEALGSTEIQIKRGGSFGGSESTGGSGEIYTAKQSGFFYGSLEVGGGSGSASIEAVIDGVTFSESGSDTYDSRWMWCFPVNAGDTIECNSSGAGSFKSYFRPLF